MPSQTVVRQSNLSFSPSYTPVIVITGATLGIGEALARLLANTLHGRARLIIVGRNRAAADAILASLTPAVQDGSYEFIPCDLTLMKNVHELAREIQSRVSKVNFLVHSAGYFGFGGRVETEEGIDVKLTTRLLSKASDLGEKASVLSILAAGMGSSEVDVHNLGLKTAYAGWRAILASASYNDLMVYDAARRHPSVAFTHIYPGAVNTGVLLMTHPLARPLNLVLRPLFWLLMKTKEDCAEYMMYALLDAEKGANRRNQYADDIGLQGYPKGEDAERLLWEHSEEATKA